MRPEMCSFAAWRRIRHRSKTTWAVHRGRLNVADGMDPTIWFDDYLDWDTVMMNPMGTVEQMGPNG